MAGPSSRRFRALLAYDGTGYHGFQRQANAQPTVQSVVEGALARIAGGPVGLLAAGRTDAGVHATGQVIAFDLAWRHPAGDLQSALNAHLPPDVAARDVRQVPTGFHPRYDALSRRYVYRLQVAEVRDPLDRLRALHLSQPLDVAAMEGAAAALVGEQDFSTFGSPPQGENAIRRVLEARWHGGPEGDVSFSIVANAYLTRMVRSIVGTLVLVGQGRMTPAEFQDILAARRRALSGPPAPPHGLYLVSVEYAD